MPKFDYQGAKNAGYSDDEIEQFLRAEVSQVPQPKNEQSLRNDISLDVSQPSARGFAGNVVSSGVRNAKDIVGGIANVFNPDMKKNTVANLGRLGVDAVKLAGGNKEKDNRARMVAAFYKDRYGGIDKIGKTLYEDPVGAALDASVVLGGGGAALKGAGTLSKSSRLAKAGTMLADISKAIDPISQAGKVAGAATAKIASGVAGGTSKRLMNSVFKETVPTTKSILKKGSKTLGEEAMDRGIKGKDAESIYKKSVLKMEELEDELTGAITGSKRVIPISDVKKTVQPIIDKYSKSGNANAVKSINDRIAELEAYNGENIPLATAQEIKRTLYEEASKGYGKLASEEMEGLKAIARGLKEGIASKVKTKDINKVNKELSVYGRIKDSMVDKLTREQRNNVLSLTDVGLGGGGLALGAGIPAMGLIAAKKILGSTGAKTFGANILNKAKVPEVVSKSGGVMYQAGKVADVMDPPMSPEVSVGEQSGNTNPADNQYPDNHMNDSVPQGSKDVNNPDEMVDVTNNETGEVQTMTRAEADKLTGGGGSGVTDEQIKQALDEAVMTGNTKQIALIKSYLETKGKLGGKANKPLSGPISVNYNKAQTAIKSVDRIAQVLEGDPDAILKKLNPTNQAGRMLGADIASAIDVLGFFRTGAAITADQRKDYIYMFPSVLDDPATKREKLSRLKEEFQGYVDGLNATRGMPETTNQYSPNASNQYLPDIGAEF